MQFFLRYYQYYITVDSYEKTINDIKEIFTKKMLELHHEDLYPCRIRLRFRTLEKFNGGPNDVIPSTFKESTIEVLNSSECISNYKDCNGFCNEGKQRKYIRQPRCDYSYWYKSDVIFNSTYEFDLRLNITWQLKNYAYRKEYYIDDKNKKKYCSLNPRKLMIKVDGIKYKYGCTLSVFDLIFKGGKDRKVEIIYKDKCYTCKKIKSCYIVRCCEVIMCSDCIIDTSECKKCERKILK